jgi:hypothetical protein
MNALAAAVSWHRLVRFGAVLLCAAVGSAVALSGYPVGLAAVSIGALGYLLFAWVSLRRPIVFAGTFLIVLEVFPPLYVSALGDRPLYPSFFLLPIAFAVLLIRFGDLRFSGDPLAAGLSLFLGGTALSLPFAWWLSGPATGMEGLSRWFLLSQCGLIYFLIRGPARTRNATAELRIYPLLLAGAVLSAAYGIIDFVWPVPLPHLAADQYIWLNNAVVRRAQGVFYESSNFANFCALFLVVCSAAFLARKERALGISRGILILFITVLTLAILVAFSRSTWISVAAAMLASALVMRLVKLRRSVPVIIAFAVPLILVWALSSELWNYFVNARLGRLIDIFSDPNVATSGRYETWIRVLAILRENPQYLVFGIGYKTLPVTRLFHSEIITDNGYLSLLLETGVIGLTGFIVWSAAVLRTFYNLARRGMGFPSFWAAVLFSFWCGELVQLLAADAYTYWRNMVIFSAVMALTLNVSDSLEVRQLPEDRMNQRRSP